MKYFHTHSVLSGLITATASLALAVASHAQGDITNPISTNLHTVDGLFTNGVGTGEWSEVTPAAFISSPGGTAVPTSLGDPNANSLLFGALGQTSLSSPISLHLLYDFLPRTLLAPITPGEIFASVTFPITLPNRPNGEKTNISVVFVDNSLPTGAPTGLQFTAFVDFNVDGTLDTLASSLNINAAANFGPSPLSSTPHLIVELDVPLRIEPTFAPTGSPLNPTGNGINPATGLYDPDPAFWGAAGAGNGGTPSAAAPPPAGSSLQSASTGLFTIQPSGALNVAPVPEPSSAALLLAGLGLLGARRRKN